MKVIVVMLAISNVCLGLGFLRHIQDSHRHASRERKPAGEPGEEELTI